MSYYHSIETTPTSCKGAVKDMLLAVDVGNTHTVIGIYDGETLLHMWRIETNAKQTSDELRSTLHGLFELAKVTPADFHGVVVATVVPALRRLWVKVGEQMLESDVLVIDVEAAGDLFDASAYPSTTIGADRIADAVAARALYGAPVIVLDFGTATNMEVIDKDGKFRGGVIAPGVETSMKALFSNAALLPEVELADPVGAWGTNTVEAMQVGIVYGEGDRVDGLVRRMWDQLGYETPVIGTGGLSRAMQPFCHTMTQVNQELTLEGLRMIWEAQGNRES